MKIYLIRHGRQCSKLCNVDVELSAEGFRQAALLGERLVSIPIDMVYSSNLQRAVQTAQMANQYWNAEHSIRTELREISFGEMEGMDDETIAEIYGDFKQQQERMEEDLPYPGGECAADVVRRADPVLREIAKSGCQNVAVITHGGVIRSLTAHYLGMDLAKVRLIGNGLENCGITELVYEAEKELFLVGRFNDYAHLEPHPELLRKHWINAEN